MKIKKTIGAVIALVLSVTVLLTGCGNSTTEKISSQDDSSSVVSDTSSIAEEKENPSSSVSEPESSSATSSVADTPSSSTDKERPESSKSDHQPGTSSKPSGGGNTGKPSNGGSANKPSKPDSSTSGNGSSSKPTEPEKPIEPPVHTHNWEKMPKGTIYNWSGTSPDENGYTTNGGIATDKNGKEVYINMCVGCYTFYGNGDKWFDRFWEHTNTEGPCLGIGYCMYAVYAVYDVYYCEGCDQLKRGAFSFYGYYDYSNGYEWIYLEPWQIEELGLPML